MADEHWNVSLSCYGNYTNRNENCCKCQYAHFCKDAADPRSNSTAWSDIAYHKDFATSHTPADELSNTEEPHCLQVGDIAIYIGALLDLDTLRHQTFIVAMARLKYPLMPQRDLAAALKMPRTSLSYHLAILGKIPELKNLFLMLSPRRQTTLEHAARFFSYLQAMINAVEKLNVLKADNDLTYRIVLLKLRHPEKSYADIGDEVTCTKQNVQYHLRKAIDVLPALEDALLIDKRFNRSC